MIRQGSKWWWKDGFACAGPTCSSRAWVTVALSSGGIVTYECAICGDKKLMGETIFKQMLEPEIPQEHYTIKPKRTVLVDKGTHYETEER